MATEVLPVTRLHRLVERQRPNPDWKAMDNIDVTDLTFDEIMRQGSDLHSEHLTEAQAMSAVSLA